jgi:hypothetical protein
MDTSKIVSLQQSPNHGLLPATRRRHLDKTISTRDKPKKEGRPCKKATTQRDNTARKLVRISEKSKQLRLACAALSAEELREWLLSHYLT